MLKRETAATTSLRLYPPFTTRNELALSRFWRSAGLGWGKKSAVPTVDLPLPRPHLPPFARLRFPFPRTALQHGFGTANPASGTLFNTPAKGGHRLFTFFLLAISMTYASGSLPTSHPSFILVRGPETEIAEG